MIEIRLTDPSTSVSEESLPEMMLRSQCLLFMCFVNVQFRRELMISNWFIFSQKNVLRFVSISELSFLVLFDRYAIRYQLNFNATEWSSRIT